MNENRNRNGKVYAAIVFGMFAFFFAMHAFANMVVRDQAGNSMTLYDKPCADGKVLAFIAMKGGKVDQFRAGLLNYEKKDYSACWMAAPDGYVYVVDDSGDISKIPMSAFVRVTGV